MKNNTSSISRPQRLSLLILLPIFAYLAYSVHNRVLPEPSKASQDENNSGWAGSFLHSKADVELNNLIDTKSRSHIYTSCVEELLILGEATKPLTMPMIESELEKSKATDDDGNLRFMELVSLKVPCGYVLFA